MEPGAGKDDHDQAAKVIESAGAPTTKLGLTESQRKGIYQELFTIEGRAQRDADASIPLDGKRADLRDRVMKNIDLMRELMPNTARRFLRPTESPKRKRTR